MPTRCRYPLDNLPIGLSITLPSAHSSITASIRRRFSSCGMPRASAKNSNRLNGRHVGIERAVFRQVAQPGGAGQPIVLHVVPGDPGHAGRGGEVAGQQFHRRALSRPRWDPERPPLRPPGPGRRRPARRRTARKTSTARRPRSSERISLDQSCGGLTALWLDGRMYVDGTRRHPPGGSRRSCGAGGLRGRPRATAVAPHASTAAAQGLEVQIYGRLGPRFAQGGLGHSLI